ncbi:MAG: ribosome maturation factor RimM [Alistipes sp.]
MTAVARISKRFGTDGELVLNLYVNFPTHFQTEEPLFAEIDALPVPLYCDKFERRGTSSALVRFADIDTDRRAAELIGKELSIGIETNATAQSDEFTMEDLIGFHVTVGKLKGVISDYYDSEINPLFELEINDRKVLVPAVEEFFARIDFDKRQIKLVLPEGLLEL